MRSLTFLLTVLLAAALLGCNASVPVNVPIRPTNKYIYTGYDSSGNVITTGYLIINIQDSSHVTGQWKIDTIGHPQSYIGPQVGNGSLSGGFNQGKLLLGINPQYVDAGVELIGTFTGNTYTGRWQFNSIRGIANSGMFRSVR